MYFWNKFCGLTAIFFLSAFFSTAQNAKYPLPLPVKRQLLSATLVFPSMNENKKVISAAPVNIVAPNYYTQHLGFICKKEIALEKITKLPLRIRLGSVQQCDYMEGKK